MKKNNALKKTPAKEQACASVGLPAVAASTKPPLTKDELITIMAARMMENDRRLIDDCRKLYNDVDNASKSAWEKLGEYSKATADSIRQPLLDHISKYSPDFTVEWFQITDARTRGIQPTTEGKLSMKVEFNMEFNASPEVVEAFAKLNAAKQEHTNSLNKGSEAINRDRRGTTIDHYIRYIRRQSADMEARARLEAVMKDVPFIAKVDDLLSKLSVSDASSKSSIES